MERAGEPGRSSDDAAAREETEAYATRSAQQQARLNNFQRREDWRALSHNVRLQSTREVARILRFFIWLAAACIIWAVFIVIVHFTIPQLAWLNATQLGLLGQFYTKSAQFIAPAALISNAYFTLQRSRPRTDNGVDR